MARQLFMEIREEVARASASPIVLVVEEGGLQHRGRLILAIMGGRGEQESTSPALALVVH